MKNRFNVAQEKGFTLLEVLMLVIIISVLAAIGIPVYQNYTVKTTFSAVVSGALPTLAAVGTCAQTGDCVSGGTLVLPSVTPANGSASIAALAAIETAFYKTTPDPSDPTQTLAQSLGDSDAELNNDATNFSQEGWSAMPDPSRPGNVCMSQGGICGVMTVPSDVFNSYYAAWAINIPCVGTSLLCTPPTKYLATAAANQDGSVTATAVQNFGLHGETVVFVPSFFNGRIDWHTSGTCKTRAGGAIC